MILIDSNILLDIIEPEGRWTEWSSRALAGAAAKGDLLVNAVVCAETARQFDDPEQQTRFFEALGVKVAPLTHEGAFRAGIAHVTYRKAGGERDGVLADFLIAGHAVALGATLLTRDRQRFATYFPELSLITPETET